MSDSNAMQNNGEDFIVERPAALSVDTWVRRDGRWMSPLIVIPDRASLVEILRLCGCDRFHEAYAFLTRDYLPYCEELQVVLGPHAQQFENGDTERLRQVWEHAEYLYSAHQGELCTLLVLELPLRDWRRSLFFQEVVRNARNQRMTVMIVEREADYLGFIRYELDTLVVKQCLNSSSTDSTWDKFFRCYDERAQFAAAHALEKAHGARLVYLLNGTYNDLIHTVRSLTIDVLRHDRDIFTLKLPHQSRLTADMDAAELDRCTTALLTGQDVFVTQEMALQLFHRSNRSTIEFAQSRHAAAIILYAAWLARALTELLAITDTSCGHFPLVLCTLVQSFL